MLPFGRFVSFVLQKLLRCVINLCVSVPFIFNETVSTAEETHSRMVQEDDHSVSVGKGLVGRGPWPHLWHSEHIHVQSIKKNPTRCKNISKFYYSIFI